jgi:hypothetical protein
MMTMRRRAGDSKVETLCLRFFFVPIMTCVTPLIRAASFFAEPQQQLFRAGRELVPMTLHGQCLHATARVEKQIMAKL